jgi:Ca2+-binding RTX toxin-like protein
MALIERNDNDNLIDGTSRADTIYAYGGDDTVYAGGGNDTIYGGAGDDWLYGGSGADDIFGGSGINTLYGGGGEDWFRMVSRSVGPSDDLIADFQSDVDRIDLRAWGVSDFNQVRVLLENTGNGSTLLNAAFDGYDHYIEIDDISAGDMLGKDFIFATPNVNNFNGTNFVDVLFGSRGHDTLVGFGAIDTLLGGAGNDTLSGGAGDDDLWGGAGRDVMTGGSGYDIFGFLTAKEINSPAGRDRITDFQPDIDQIDFSRMDADKTLGGKQDFEWIGNDAFDAPGQLRYFTSGGMTYVAGNLDNDSAPEFRLELDGNFALIRADFIL